MANRALFLVCLMLTAGGTEELLRIKKRKYRESKSTIVGKNLKLFCELPKNVDDIRSISYEWLKDGKVIDPSSSKYKMRRLKFLKIKSAVKSDAGTYKCIIRKGDRSDSISTKVTVSEPEALRFVRRYLSPGLVDIVGNRIKLDCTVHSSDPFTITWYFNGKKLNLNEDNKDSRIRISRNGQVLTLLQLHLNDKGKYECFVSNKRASINRTISVIPHELNRARPEMLKPKDNTTIYASIGQNITVECVANAYRNAHFQLLRLSQLKNGSFAYKVVTGPTQYEHRMPAAGSAGLTLSVKFFFNGISENDFALYSCLASNVVGTSSTSFRLARKPGPVIATSDSPRREDLLKIKRSKYRERKSTIVGKNLKLFCELPKNVDDIRSFSYQWLKDGNVIDPRSSEYKIRKFKFLKIKSAEKSDAGTYKCIISKGAWSDSISTIVTVSLTDLQISSPFLDSPKDNSTIYASVGENTSVECIAYAAGEVHFKLLRVTRGSNGSTTIVEVKKKPLLFKNDPSETLRRSRAVFKFDNVRKEDFLLYTCMATNSVGYSTASFRLAERAKPS